MTTFQHRFTELSDVNLIIWLAQNPKPLLANSKRIPQLRAEHDLNSEMLADGTVFFRLIAGAYT